MSPAYPYTLQNDENARRLRTKSTCEQASLLRNTTLPPADVLVAWCTAIAVCRCEEPEEERGMERETRRQRTACPTAVAGRSPAAQGRATHSDCAKGDRVVIHTTEHSCLFVQVLEARTAESAQMQKVRR